MAIGYSCSKMGHSCFSFGATELSVPSAMLNSELIKTNEQISEVINILLAIYIKSKAQKRISQTNDV